MVARESPWWRAGFLDERGSKGPRESGALVIFSRLASDPGCPFAGWPAPATGLSRTPHPNAPEGNGP